MCVVCITMSKFLPRNCTVQPIRKPSLTLTRLNFGGVLLVSVLEFNFPLRSISVEVGGTIYCSTIAVRSSRVNGVRLSDNIQ